MAGVLIGALVQTALRMMSKILKTANCKNQRFWTTNISTRLAVKTWKFFVTLIIALLHSHIKSVYSFKFKIIIHIPYCTII